MTDRTCTTCGETKPATLEFFHRRREGLTSECKVCRSARARRRYEAKREGILAQGAEYRARNPEKRREASQAYLANPAARAGRAAYAQAYRATTDGREKRREANRRFRATEHGRMRVLITAHDIRARAAGVVSDLTVEDWVDVLRLFDGECAYCGSPESITVEHVVSITARGPNTKRNVIPACWSCNHSKRDKDMATWYAAHPEFTEARLEKILSHTG